MDNDQNWLSPKSPPTSNDPLADTVAVFLLYEDDFILNGFFILPQGKGDEGLFMSALFMTTDAYTKEFLAPYRNEQIKLVGWRLAN